MNVERVSVTARACILYDASRVRKSIESVFDRSWWAKNGTIEEVTGGRASVFLLRHQADSWVLRHYRRGGFIANFSADRYIWTGESRCRSFAEWRLLARLHSLGLPVPAPVAARYVRGALTYTADLITEFLHDTISLAKAISSSQLDEALWHAVGRTIASFHAQGVHHADLNAHNVLLRLSPSTSQLDKDRRATNVYLLDFDRGRIREPGEWEAEVLARFRRSLEKVSRLAGQVFEDRCWLWMMEGYAGGERRAADGGR
jgi:3-deoxy-D-manno-octulosonic acid kinase